MIFPVQQYINNRRNWHILLLWSYCMPLRCSLPKFTIIWVTNWTVWQMKGCFSKFLNSVFSWNTDLSSFFYLKNDARVTEFTINLIDDYSRLLILNWSSLHRYGKYYRLPFIFVKETEQSVTRTSKWSYFFKSFLQTNYFLHDSHPVLSFDNKWSIVDWTERSLKQVCINS